MKITPQGEVLEGGTASAQLLYALAKSIYGADATTGVVTIPAIADIPDTPA